MTRFGEYSEFGNVHVGTAEGGCPHICKLSYLPSKNASFPLPSRCYTDSSFMTEQKRSRTWLWILIGGGAFFLFVLAVFTLVYLTLRAGRRREFVPQHLRLKIGVVDLEGIIADPRTIVDQIKKFDKDDSIKAIILHVNSPGGGVAASEEIYREVKRVRDEKKKPIVVSIETVGASGAYYVSSAATRIFADKGSIVGSIGVIAEWVNYGDLLHWAKLKAGITMKAGEFKDTGSPTREMTPAEQAYLQSLIDNMHTQFIQAVAEGRKEKVDRSALSPMARSGPASKL